MSTSSQVGSEPAGRPDAAPERGGDQEVSDARGGELADRELQQTFERTVEEGDHRLNRSWPGLLSTGTMGGLDVGTGVFALLLVTTDTGDELLGALAFGLGFVALLLGRSELFTENFLVPIAARTTQRRSRLLALTRLWSGTLVTNLAGGWVMMVVVMNAFPRLAEVAVEVARHYLEQGIGVESFAGSVLGRMIITLMTWMERGTQSVPARLVAVVGAAFLLAAGPLNHVIVISIEMFAALIVGAPFGYADLAGIAAWAGLGNLVGGIGLVTVLRLVQVGRREVERERERSE